MKVRLRDFIVTKDGWIFAVSDYTHTGGVRCVLRYVPDPSGSRGMTQRYRKFDFNESFEFMRRHRPAWAMDVHIVPFDEVARVLVPSRRLAELVDTDERIAAIVNTLIEGGVPLSKMGITGSFLAGLNNESSDIDFIVYGKAWFRARDIIARAKRRGGVIRELSGDMWQLIYNKRVPDISFDEFMLHEKRKGNRGMVGSTYFDLLYVRDWEDIETIERGTDIDRATITARVTNADFSFDSPAVYKIEHEEVESVLSYTHTYAGQALPGECIEACGMLEDAGGVKRLVVGTSREPRGEWIRSLTLLGRTKD